MLILLIEGITKYADGLPSCGMTYIPSFMKIGTGIQAISGVCLRNLGGCNVGITDGRDSFN
jgi:hypothetical protein